MLRLFNRRTIKAMSRRKTLAEAQESSEESGNGLRRSLTAIDLVLFGVGSSVGAGIFVLVGLGAKLAGPAISLSFLGCGMTCILTSLAYAEFASRIPASGSAFTYVYVAFGEFYAWIVGELEEEVILVVIDCSNTVFHFPSFLFVCLWCAGFFLILG